MFDQFSLQRIHVHVVELFDLLLQTPHLEIVETPLQKRGSESTPLAKFKFNWPVYARRLRRKQRETRCFKI